MKIEDSQRPVRIQCAVSSVVEHFLDTEGVRGSNPLSRTTFNQTGYEGRNLFLPCGVFIRV